jgi:hypothetical protein
VDLLSALVDALRALPDSDPTDSAQSLPSGDPTRDLERLAPRFPELLEETHLKVTGLSFCPVPCLCIRIHAPQITRPMQLVSGAPAAVNNTRVVVHPVVDCALKATSVPVLLMCILPGVRGHTGCDM